ncbi:hypothetical protein Tco_0368403 [Tanacetum coccineum]
MVTSIGPNPWQHLMSQILRELVQFGILRQAQHGFLLREVEGSEGFHQIIDFLTASHIKNALIDCPTLYASLIEQFWQTSVLSITKDGVMRITATIDRKVKVFVSEASIRRHLKLEDFDGINYLPTT